MRKTTTILLLLFVALAVQAQKTRVIENPSCAWSNTSHMEITRVEVNKQVTIVNINLYHSANYWVRVNGGAVLRGNTTGREYKLLSADGILLDTEIWIPDSCKLSATLHFEPLSPEDDKIDFCEPDVSGAWKLLGINLTDFNFDGSWSRVGATGDVVAAFRGNMLLYDGEAWKYSVSGKASDMTIDIASGGKSRRLFAKLKKDGTLLLKTGRKEKGILLTRKEQQPLEAAPYSYDPASVSPKLFTKGKAHVKGFIPNSDVNVLNVETREHISNNEKMEIVEIGKDGSFNVDIELDYPQYVLFDGTSFIFTLFVVPGDTLVCNIDKNDSDYERWKLNKKSQFLGNNISAQVNRYDKIAKNHLLPNSRRNVYEYRNKYIVSPETMKAYADKQAAFMDSLYAKAPAVFARYPMDKTAKDFIFTNLICRTFENMLNILMEYEMKEPTDSVPLDWNDYFSFFGNERHFKNLLDNPLLLCSDSRWVVFNRFAFSVVHPTYFAAVQKYQNDTTLTRESFYFALFEAMQRPLSVIDRNVFMAQAAIGELMHWDVDMDELTSEIVAAIPQATNALVRRKLIERYREEIAKNEGTVAVNEHPEVTAFLKSLHDKYPGEVIILDFWGLGCGPCKQAMLSQRELVKEYAGKVRFVYVCSAINPDEDVKSFFKDNEIKGEDVRVSMNLWARLEHRFNFNAIPHIEIMKKDGTMRNNSENIHINRAALTILLSE